MTLTRMHQNLEHARSDTASRPRLQVPPARTPTHAGARKLRAAVPSYGVTGMPATHPGAVTTGPAGMSALGPLHKAFVVTPQAGAIVCHAAVGRALCA